MDNRALHSPVQSKLYSKYRLSSGSSKPLFVSLLELVTKLHLEKNKLQELTVLEIKEPEKTSHMHRKIIAKRHSL